MKNIRKLFLVLCIAFCMCLSISGNISFAAIELDSKTEELIKSDVSALIDILQQDENTLNEQVSNYSKINEEMANAIKNAYNSWNNIISNLGEYNSIIDTAVATEGDFIKSTSQIKFANNTAEMIVTYNSESYITSIDFNQNEEKTSLGQKMSNAILNTIIGMLVVFVMLIFISFIISLLAYVPSMVEKFKKKEIVIEKTETIIPQVTSVPEIEEEEEDLTDDLELVAVITAAIMASMGDEVPADGLLVKSIKRKKTNKWQRA